MAYSQGNGSLIEDFQNLFWKSDLISSLQHGAWFQEIRPQIHFHHPLIFIRLDKDVTRLEYGSDQIKFIYLVDITHVRYGWNTDTFNGQMCHQFREDCCLSIVYGARRQTLDLQAKDCRLAELFVNNVSHLVDAIRKRATRSDKTEWIRRHFKESEKTNFNECCRILNFFNISLEKSKVEKYFGLSNSNRLDSKTSQKADVLDDKDFLRFYHLVSQRPELMALFQHYARGETSISVGNLSNFLRQEQQTENLTDYAQSLIESFKLPATERSSSYLRMEFLEFQAMMNSSLFDILKKEHRQVNQDMSQPLSNYYISSSHNTYLVGDQLMGVSSIEGYIAALESGCRCLELDLWDGPDGQPIIYHGYTKTSKLLAKDVLIKAIRPFAFKYSPYPLILSIENHLSIAQQAIFANDLRYTFNSSIYVWDDDVAQSFLPSPEELIGKILIHATGAKVCCPALQSLLQVCRSFSNFDKLQDAEEMTTSPYCIVSMSESEAVNSLKKVSREPVGNLQVVVRVYPTATRMGSSNFNAVPFWNYGCQMVALNFQTNDKHLEVNFGHFRRNGSCGYVLKPDYLLGKIGKFPIASNPRQILLIRIISSQYLPKRPGLTRKGNYYVTIRIEGHPIDAFKFKTNYFDKNGMNPRSDDETAIEICYPQLALICFHVKFVDTFKMKQFISSYCLPVESLAPGYRHVPMSTRDAISSIFVHVKINRL